MRYMIALRRVSHAPSLLVLHALALMLRALVQVYSRKRSCARTNLTAVMLVYGQGYMFYYNWLSGIDTQEYCSR